MPSKIELIEKGGKYFIRKQGRFFAQWWYSEAWESGWRMFFPYAMSKDEANATFLRLQEEILDQICFDAAPEKVVKTFIP